MKNLGKKAVHGAPGKAASMKKADVPGEWLYFAPEAVGVRQIADALEGTCEMEIWQEAGVLEICTAEKPPWTWRKEKYIPGIR